MHNRREDTYIAASRQGKSIKEGCRGNKISEQTFHRWKREFGMIDVNRAKRKELKKE